jgi:hypothetical protein
MDSEDTFEIRHGAWTGTIQFGTEAHEGNEGWLRREWEIWQCVQPAPKSACADAGDPTFGLGSLPSFVSFCFI